MKNLLRNKFPLARNSQGSSYLYHTNRILFYFIRNLFMWQKKKKWRHIHIYIIIIRGVKMSDSQRLKSHQVKWLVCNFFKLNKITNEIFHMGSCTIIIMIIEWMIQQQQYHGPYIYPRTIDKNFHSDKNVNWMNMHGEKER